MRGAECRVVLAVLSGGEVHQRMCRGHSEVGQRLRGAQLQTRCRGAEVLRFNRQDSVKVQVLLGYSGAE